MKLILKTIDIFKEFSLPGKISVMFIFLVIVMAIFAPYFSIYPPIKIQDLL